MSDPRVEGLRCDDDAGNYESDRQKRKKKKKKGHRFQCFTFPRRRKYNSDDGRDSSKFSGGGGSLDAFGCFSCLGRKQSSESMLEPQTSDPNSSEFTQEMLRDLIEKNDFYSKECNPYVFD